MLITHKSFQIRVIGSLLPPKVCGLYLSCCFSWHDLDAYFGSVVCACMHVKSMFSLELGTPDADQKQEHLKDVQMSDLCNEEIKVLYELWEEIRPWYLLCR